MSKVTLFIPCLVPPASDGMPVPPAQRHPALERILARASASNAPCESVAAWLCASFGSAKQKDWPAAPIALYGEGGDPGQSYWLHASPVHLRAQRDQLVLLPPALLPVSEAESRALIETLNRHFSGDGLMFVAPHPQRWYLRLPSAPDLYTTALEQAAGRDINRLLPTGDDRMRYHHLFNEVQMLLHDHPVNESRETSDALPINSVWLAEGGSLPAAHPGTWTACIGDMPLLMGLGRLAGVPVRNLSAGIDSIATGNVLLVLPEGHAGDETEWAGHLGRLEQEWIAPLLRKLRAGDFRCLEIATVHAGRSRQWTITARDLWKFWKPVLPLSQQLAATAR